MSSNDQINPIQSPNKTSRTTIIVGSIFGILFLILIIVLIIRLPKGAFYNSWGWGWNRPYYSLPLFSLFK
jgi:hypothetical protein